MYERCHLHGMCNLLSLTHYCDSLSKTHTHMYASKQTQHTVTSCLSLSCLQQYSCERSFKFVFPPAFAPHFHTIPFLWTVAASQADAAAIACYLLIIIINRSHLYRLQNARRESEGVEYRSSCAQVRRRAIERQWKVVEEVVRSFLPSFSHSVSLSYSLCRLFLFAPFFGYRFLFEICI